MPQYWHFWKVLQSEEISNKANFTCLANSHKRKERQKKCPVILFPLVLMLQIYVQEKVCTWGVIIKVYIKMINYDKYFVKQAREGSPFLFVPSTFSCQLISSVSVLHIILLLVTKGNYIKLTSWPLCWKCWSISLYVSMISPYHFSPHCVSPVSPHTNKESVFQESQWFSKGLVVCPYI